MTLKEMKEEHYRLGKLISTAGGCVLVPTTKTLHDEYDKDTDFGYFEEMSKREVLGV